MIRKLVLVSLLLLAGCARFAWVREGSTPADFGADRYACLQSAMDKAPPVIGVYENKRRMGDRYDAAMGMEDMNSGNRDMLYRACLEARGWRLERVEDSAK